MTSQWELSNRNSRSKTILGQNIQIPWLDVQVLYEWPLVSLIQFKVLMNDVAGLDLQALFENSEKTNLQFIDMHGDLFTGVYCVS